jgi:hypothetical protein
VYFTLQLSKDQSDRLLPNFERQFEFSIHRCTVKHFTGNLRNKFLLIETETLIN